MSRTSLALAILLLATPAFAQEQAFPLDRLGKKDKQEVQRIRRDASVATKVPSRPVRCRSSVYRYLLTHLPVASRWLRALGVGDYQIVDNPDGSFSIDDKLGARARCTRPLDEQGVLVVIARGVLDVSVLPTINGTGVILVRYTPVEGKPGVLDCEATVDFRLDSGVLHALSRPFRRTLSNVLRQKLDDLVKDATELGEAIQKNPTAVYQRLEEAKDVSRADLDAFRAQFLSL